MTRFLQFVTAHQPSSVSVSRRPQLKLKLSLLLVVLGMGAAGVCQSDNPVHITPRRQPQPEAVLDTHTRPYKVDVNVVLVPVTVTDPMNRLVTGLGKKAFSIFQDKEKQPIRYFSSQDAPVSIGIVFDLSGSMKEKMESAREAVMDFLRTANPEDEFFVITFSDKPELLHGFTGDIRDIESKLVFTIPKGETSLLDAVYLGLNEMRHARYQKRALLVISDGGDNHSRYTEGEVKSRLQEADTLLYAIGIYNSYYPTPEERLGPYVMAELAEVTGGRAFTITNPNDLSDVATKIGVELRNQYVVGYVPSQDSRDGKWHKIKVKLDPPKGLPPLRVYAKKGFYAPE